MEFLNFSEAKPCPFCNGHPYNQVRARDDHMIKVSIGCYNCKIEFSNVVGLGCSIEEIIKAYNKCLEKWNRRA